MAEKRKRRAVPSRDSRRSNVESSSETQRSWTDEALGISFSACALFLLLGLVSAQLHSKPNWMGPVGGSISGLLLNFMGWCAFVPFVWLAGLSIFYYRFSKGLSASKSRLLLALGLSGVLVFSCTLAALYLGAEGGGVIGIVLAEPLEAYFSRGGGSLIAAALFLLSAALATQRTAGGILAEAISLLTSVVVVAFIKLPLALGSLLFGFMGMVGRAAWDSLKFCGFGLAAGAKRFFAFWRSEGREEPLPIELKRQAIVERQLRPVRAAREEAKPLIERKVSVAKAPKKRELRIAEDEKAYSYPPVNLLLAGEKLENTEDEEEFHQKSILIQEKLADFGINGRVTHVHPGPVITLFEFEPAAGVKVGKIASLQDDLSMALKASAIRIIAPIPGRGTVGIEVPNRQRELVRLREVVESEPYTEADSLLSIAMGKNTYGEPVVVDIARMPHLLLAGATGTGKSVCINTILLSLLYRASPAELGLILIDPKILELSVYEGIPHLRVPVVTVPKKAKAVLEWAVNEMNRRYYLMQQYGVRSIDGFNALAKGEEPQAVEEVDEIESAEAVEPLVTPQVLKPLSKIVIVIDELADLMLTVGREIEDLITRLAQKARAAGIHLVVATQRPSVDVVTGLIKANFPARISFRVASRIDSRTILDANGAEALLGRGDLLFKLPDQMHVRRIHGAFVSDEEVNRVVAKLKEQGQPRYDQEIIEICERAMEEDRDEGGLAGEIEYDSFYDQAVDLVLKKGQASTSMLQRAFRIGYNRAARIIELMEQEGIVGPMDGVKPREVIIPRAEGE